MIWDFNGDGSWDAASRITADGSMLYWRIGVCDDGTFDVSESYSELTDRKQTFPTLSEAKRWCEQQEQIQFSEACKPLPEHLPPDDPTDSQLHAACMWFRHDYGLLERDVRVELQATARGWLAAWQKALGGNT